MFVSYIMLSGCLLVWLCQLGNTAEAYVKVGSNPKIITPKQTARAAIVNALAVAYRSGAGTVVATPVKPVYGGDATPPRQVEARYSVHEREMCVSEHVYRTVIW